MLGVASDHAARRPELDHLWLELELSNRGDGPWRLRPDELVVRVGSTHATGAAFGDAPDAMAVAELVLPAGTTRRSWLRFDRVEVSQRGPIVVELRTPGAERALALDGPPDTPRWRARPYPYVGTLRLGGTAWYGEQPLPTSGPTAAGVDLGYAFHRRFAAFDVALVGSMRVARIADTLASTLDTTVSCMGWLGAGFGAGYTLRGGGVSLRPSLDVSLLTTLGVLDATAAIAGAQLDLGLVRSAQRDVRTPRANFELGLYVRGETHLARTSAAMDLFDMSVSAGVIARAGT